MKILLMIITLAITLSCKESISEEMLGKINEKIKNGEKDHLRRQIKSYYEYVNGLGEDFPEVEVLKKMDLDDEDKNQLNESKVGYGMLGAKVDVEMKKFMISLNYIVKSDQYLLANNEKYVDQKSIDLGKKKIIEDCKDKLRPFRYCELAVEKEGIALKDIPKLLDEKFKIVQTYKKGELYKSNKYTVTILKASLNGGTEYHVKLKESK